MARSAKRATDGANSKNVAFQRKAGAVGVSSEKRKAQRGKLVSLEAKAEKTGTMRKDAESAPGGSRGG